MSKLFNDELELHAASNASIPKPEGLELGSSIPEKVNSALLEQRQKEFPAYLEQIGFTQALTQVVIALYQEPEIPDNPIEYFLNRLTANIPLKDNLLAAREQLFGYEKQLESLTAENEFLRERLLHHERIPDPLRLEMAGELEDSDENQEDEDEDDEQGKESDGMDEIEKKEELIMSNKS